jgi:class 3 adenylate cyclase
VLDEIAHDVEFIAHERPHASVMVCDIAGFAHLAASLPPEDTVAILNVSPLTSSSSESRGAGFPRF